jgi:hypothetical protein
MRTSRALAVVLTVTVGIVVAFAVQAGAQTPPIPTVPTVPPLPDLGGAVADLVAAVKALLGSLLPGLLGG